MRRSPLPMFWSGVVAVLSAVVLTIPAGAGAGGPVTSNLMVSLDGLVFSPGSGYEDVALTGRMHLVTQVSPGDACTPTDPCRLFINLADVKGTGVDSRLSYIAIGAVGESCTPVDPCFAQFVIMAVAAPPKPVQPGNPNLAIRFAVTIGFDAEGNLSADTTTVEVVPSCLPGQDSCSL